MTIFEDDLTVVPAGEAGQGIQTIETLLTRLLKTGGYHVFATKVIYMNEKRTSFEENLPLYLYDKRPLYERETPLSMIKRLLEPYI